jgi:hypothetical protein
MRPEGLGKSVKFNYLIESRNSYSHKSKDFKYQSHKFPAEQYVMLCCVLMFHTIHLGVEMPKISSFSAVLGR